MRIYKGTYHKNVPRIKMIEWKLTAALLATQLIFFVSVGSQTQAPVVCNFLKFDNKNSPGGKFVGAITLSDCQSQCSSTNQCRNGFDYSEVGCWISTNPFDDNSYAPGISHYSCEKPSGGTTLPATLTPNGSPPSTCTAFQSMIRTNTPNGKSDPAMTSEDCKAHCISLNGCFQGFDWVESPTAKTRCFISTSTQLGILDGVTHYACTSSPRGVAVNSSATRDQLLTSGALLVIFTIIVQIMF